MVQGVCAVCGYQLILFISYIHNRAVHGDFGMRGDLSPPHRGGTDRGGQALHGGGLARDFRNILNIEVSE